MTSAAAFQATFSDWKLIKTRKVVQVVLEIPLEGADVAYQALGGMPDPAKEIWVASTSLAQIVENEAHKLLDTRCLSGEWFDIGVNESENAVRKIMEQFDIAEQIGNYVKYIR